MLEFGKYSLVRLGMVVLFVLLMALVALGSFWVAKRFYHQGSTARQIRPSEEFPRVNFSGPQLGNAGLLAATPWPMFQGSPQHSGRSLYVGPEEIKVRWCF